ncbi:MAG: WS/DGAT domain-containing protein [Gordonia paraffinivorans]
MNQFAASIVDLHTDIDDPLERVAAVSDSATAAKARVRATQSARSPELPGPLLRLLGGLSRTSRLNARSAVATVAITNIGPTRGVDTMAGSWVDAMYGMQTLGPGCLLAHSIRTVRDRLVVSVTTDDGVMADPSVYLGFIEESVAAHRAAASVT